MDVGHHFRHAASRLARAGCHRQDLATIAILLASRADVMFYDDFNSNIEEPSFPLSFSYQLAIRTTEPSTAV